MKTISRYIMTLALLITAVGGAWADEKTINWTIGNGDDSGWGGSVTQNGIKIQCNSDDAKVANSSNPCFFECYESSEYVTFTISMEDGSDILGVNMTLAENGDAFQNLDGWTGSGDTRTWTGKAKSVDLRVNRKGYYDEFENWQNQYLRVSALSVTVDAPAIEPAIEVTTNKAENDTVFTEAWFNMPAFDATAEYELVRDMTYEVNAYVGTTPDADYRHRVVKVDENLYKPVDITTDAQLIALFPVIDVIDAQNPKTLTYGTDYTLAIVDEQENEIEPTEFDFAPGTYTIKVTGKGDYDGVIDSQNAFKLYLGVDITVPAGELVTYYSDETLYTEEEDAVIYTITDVSGTEATATELTIVPANTPFLVKNTADERKTFLFIVTDGDQLPAVNYYPGFTGTLNATTIDASTADQTNYAFNGKQFVFVKDAIEVGPNKAWLSISNSNARAITLVFDETTGVESGELRTENGEFATAAWYDLNGRKLQGMPTKKGVYIMNGRKVVIR